MYICICNAITEDQAKQALDNGAQNLHELQSTLGLGTQCGSCREHARSLIKQHCHSKCEHSNDSNPLPLTQAVTI